jgi:hypothetical protein
MDATLKKQVRDNGIGGFANTTSSHCTLSRQFCYDCLSYVVPSFRVETWKKRQTNNDSWFTTIMAHSPRAVRTRHLRRLARQTRYHRFATFGDSSATISSSPDRHVRRLVRRLFAGRPHRLCQCLTAKFIHIHTCYINLKTYPLLVRSTKADHAVAYNPSRGLHKNN